MSEQNITPSRTTRRTFLQAASLAATSFVVGHPDSLQAAPIRFGPHIKLKPKSVILFQGDSITDAGRDRNRQANPNDPLALGRGYAFLATAQLLAAHPNLQLKIYNRGISGNKVFQLAERWQQDCLDLKPDLLSILIGVNDIWHRLTGNYTGTAATYEKDYDALLARTRRHLPDVQLVICEPFVLRCGAVNDRWFPDFHEFRRIAKQMARKYNAVFVPFQQMFDHAVTQAPPEYWARDGVHPTIAGAALMARHWLDAVIKTDATTS